MSDDAFNFTAEILIERLGISRESALKMAAAPELLEACRANDALFLEAITKMGIALARGGERVHTEDVIALFMRARDKVRAAIAKAEARS